MRKVKEIFDKIKSNKKILIPIISIALLLVLITGVSLAVFNYSNDNAGNNDINSGHISMTYTEPSNEYVVENALPMKDAEGMNTSNYFEFSVTTTVPTNDTDDNGVSIPYEITITESEDNTLTSEQIKMYVTEVEGEKEITHIAPTLVSNLEDSIYKNEGTKVGFNLHLHRNGNETITTKYRLRAWLDYDVDVSDWDTAGEFVYKFKVNVNGEATYQGYETDQSCFAYEKNDNNNYSITGYDFNKCGGKNIVIPETLIVDSDIILENINWVSDEEFIEAYKNYVYEQGMCSSDLSWNDCLTQNNITEAELLAQYPDIKSAFNEYIGYKKDDGNLDSLNMFLDMGICTLEWSEGEKITVKVDTIKSFSNTTVAAVSNKNDVYSVNNLNNITGKYKTSLSTMADTIPIINGLIIPEDIIIENDAFSTIEINQLIDRKGNFPSSCFVYTSGSNDTMTITKYKCKGVVNVVIPSIIDEKNVTSIKEEAFQKKELKSVRLPEGLLYIKARAFESNNIKTIDLPDSILSIESGAFGSNLIIKLEIPEKITDVRGFYNNKLTELIIPEGVTKIGDFNSNELTSIKLPKSLTEIYDLAFFNNKLKEIIIPENVTKIGDGAFAYNQLTSVTIPKKVSYLSGFNGNDITNIEIPDSVTEIGVNAFCYNKIEKLIVPDNVLYIRRDAFQNNNLSNLMIGKGVVDIGIGSFAYNPKLLKIISKTTTPLNWYQAIINSSSDDKIQTGTIWTEYGNVEIVTE